MLYALKDGTKLLSKHRMTYTVKRFIASGGQGEVYEVDDKKGQAYALKWYYPHAATPYQQKLIERLIERGAPDPCFLWPLDIIASPQKGEKAFGYVMRLRTPTYKSIVDLMKRRAEPTFSALCMAAINLADGYQSLHSQGLCYRDISFGNLFFNPADGEVLICDNDNVTVNQDTESGTYGTPRFMAPEIITLNKSPSTETDLYSMAVLLFYMFVLHHPLEGAIEANIKCFDAKAMEKIYGHDPIFIYDPKNDKNRPIPGYQDNAIIFWHMYPPYLREMFTRAFTDGLRNGNARIVEKEWKDAFVRLRNSILYCHGCGAENFFNKKPTCWKCRANITPPPRLNLGRQLLMLNHNSAVFAHHLHENFDFSTRVGKVSQHPQDPKRWGLTNESKDSWTYTKTSGDTAIIEPGKTAPLATGAKINFGPIEGTIE
ncbi:MAG: protein kinase [Defluviitaleaceae bacterium]|nr:protein kinase [Defluviitaleaceae bacterium]MCL2274619.1 protein kinase [Defluviitaleaceae bacterium]